MRKPCNVESEKSILASIVLKPGSSFEWVNKLSPDHFSDSRLSRLFSAMKSEIIRHGEFDASSLLEKDGGQELMKIFYDFIDIAKVSAKPEYYFRQLERVRVLRQISSLVEEAMENQDDDESINGLKAGIMAVGRENSKTMTPRELAQRAVDRWESNSGDHKKPAVYLGLPGVDDIVRLKLGQVAMLIAPPKSGKTWLLVNSSLHVATGRKTMFVSAEMHPDDLYLRSCSRLAEIDLMKLDYGRPRKDLLKEWQDKALPVMEKKKLNYVKASGISFGGLVGLLYEAKAMGVEVVYIDYLQRIYNKAESQRIAVMHMTRRLVDIAAELDILLVVASQAGRSARAEKTTKGWHGKESGSIEEDAFVILAVTLIDEDGDMTGLIKKMSIDITQRNGKGCVVEANINLQTGQMWL